MSVPKDSRKESKLSLSVLARDHAKYVIQITKNPNVFDPKNVKAQRKKLYRLVAKSKKGLIPKESADESYRSWRDHASKGNTFTLLQRMDNYYADLWRTGNAQDNKKVVSY